MADYSKQRLSASSNGRGIKLVETASPGTLLHTAVSGSTDMDEVWLYVTNNHTAALTVTIEWGGTTNPDDRIQMSIPPRTGLYLLVPGLVLQGGVSVRAFAQTANLLSMFGWVNRITG